MMEAGYQQAGSPAPEGIAVGDRRRWPRAAVVAGAVAAALLVGAATRGRPPPVAALATADATTAGEAATPFRVGAYSEGYGRLNTSYYPFLFGKADAVLVERRCARAACSAAMPGGRRSGGRSRASASRGAST